MPTHRLNRREFIGRSGLGILSAGLGIPVLHSSCSKQPGIIKRTLGRTNLEIPVVSYGVMNSDNPHMLMKACDMGITHLDTAHSYIQGKSEQVIGQVVEEMGIRGKISIATKLSFDRDQEKGVFTSRGGSQRPLANRENFDRMLALSLERLRTDYVDILYLHSCYSPAMVMYEPMMEELVRAKEEGRTRFIGVSTHRDVPEVTRAAVDAGIYDVVEIAYNWMAERREEIREATRYAAENGVGIVAMKVMGGNRLNREPGAQINHKAALKWVLNDENVTTTIPGMTTFEQMDLNWSVMTEGIGLTEDETRELNVASLVPGKLYCQNCRSCIGTCPNRVEIPNLMRSYMYAEGYGNHWQALDAIGGLPVGKGIDACRECAACSARCRHAIPIGERIGCLQPMISV